jgi:hypothetical protein
MLIECSECNSRISDRAPNCPQCGAPGPASSAGKGPDIKALQILGIGIAIAGLALYLVGASPDTHMGGGMMMVLGLILALL